MIARGTSELDEYYANAKGFPEVETAEDIADMPWRFRQFAIQDNYGNLLTFSKFLEGGNPRARISPFFAAPLSQLKQITTDSSFFIGDGNVQLMLEAQNPVSPS